LIKSIDHFNQELSEEGSEMKLVLDTGLYSLRIAKKKNGKPNTDYPSKLTTRIFFIDHIVSY
jgi:hypothetical protein